MLQWKLSLNDLASLDRWDDFTRYKDAMFRRTHHPHGPWTVVRSNDKMRGAHRGDAGGAQPARVSDKDDEIVGEPDPLIVGPPEVV